MSGHPAIKDYFQSNTARATAVVFFATGLLFVVLTLNKHIGDFGNYYYGSRLFLDKGFDLQVYSTLDYFNSKVQAYGQTNFFGNYIPVPPFSLIFYLPFAFFTAGTAKLLFNCLGLLLLSAALYRLLRSVHVNKFVPLLLPLAFAYPLYQNILQGQAYLLVLALLLEAFTFSEREKTIAPALFLSLIISLKIFPAFMLIYFFIRKKFSIPLFAVLFTCVIYLATAFLVGTDILWHYAAEVLPKLAGNHVIGTYHHVNQSVYTVLLRLFDHEQMHNPRPLFDLPLIVPIIESLFIAAIIGLLANMRKHGNVLLFGFTAFVLCLTGRYHPGYSALLLLLFFVSLAGHENRKRTLIVIFILFIVATGLPAFLAGEAWSANFLRLAGLFGLLVFCILLFRPKPEPRVFLLVFIVLLSFRLLMFRNQDPDYFPYQNSKGILYKVEVTGNALRLFNISRDGESINTFYPAGKLNTAGLIVKGDEIWRKDRRLYSSRDNKRDPFIYNDSMLVFMSDLNQPPGFFVLRVVRVK